MCLASTSVPQQLSVVSQLLRHFFCAILLICDRLSVHRRAIFESPPPTHQGEPVHSSKSGKLWSSHMWARGPCPVLCTMARVYIHILPLHQNISLPYSGIPDETKQFAPVAVLKTAVWAHVFVFLINLCLCNCTNIRCSLWCYWTLYKINVCLFTMTCLRHVRLHLTKMLLRWWVVRLFSRETNP